MDYWNTAFVYRLIEWNVYQYVDSMWPGNWRERAATRFWYNKRILHKAQCRTLMRCKERKCLRKMYSGYFGYPVCIFSYVPSVNIIGKCKPFCEAVTRTRMWQHTHTPTHTQAYSLYMTIYVYITRKNK